MRYRAEDEQRLKKTVSDFNKKVRKLEKAGQVAPEKISLTETRKYVQESRQDFNREMKRLERFQRENAAKPHTFKEYGVTVTHWEAVEVQRQITVNNRKRAKIREEMQELDVKNSGKTVLGSDGKPLKRAQMQGPQSNALKPKVVDLNKTYTLKSFRMLQEAVKKEAQKTFYDTSVKNWKKNYLKALNLAFPGKEGAKLRKHIRSLPPEQFAKIMRSDQNAEIAFSYSGSKKKFEMIEQKKLLNTLNNIWFPAADQTEVIPLKK